MTPTFSCDRTGLQERFAQAIDGLRSNVKHVYGFESGTLLEGGAYPGVWLECAPHEGLVYAAIDPAVGQANHDVFFRFQREDGYLPCFVWFKSLGSGQIQMVVPIAKTALELFKLIGDEAFLRRAYDACSRWDQWLSRYRNTRGTGLCELFCEWDSGHDNSPRVRPHLPHDCPDNDARRCPDVPGLPWLAPDLSATVYGGRIALAEMARLLGKQDKAQQWNDRAALIQRAMLEHLFDEEDGFFYDRDAQGQFVRVRGDVITRVLCEHVVDQTLFERIYDQHVHSPARFWTPYPLPSIAIDDPKFVKDLPDNSWGGASQALTALRTPRWFEHYGKFVDHAHLMTQWVNALGRSPAFRQQINPWTGESRFSDGYSPAMLCMIDFVARLHGARSEPGSDRLEWNCRAPAGASTSRYTSGIAGRALTIETRDGQSTLSINSRQVARVTGTVRLVTRLDGTPVELIGTHAKAQHVRVATEGAERTLEVEPDSRVAWA